MDRQFQIALLEKKIGGDWGRSSVQTLSRAMDIRELVSILDEPYLALDDIAMEIETMSGTAIGMGDELLSEDEVLFLNSRLNELRNMFLSVSMSSKLD